MALSIRRYAADTEADFERLHDDANDAGWCRCVAWWVPSWEGWGERSAEQNLDLRRGLCSRAQHDGYLLYDDSEVVGWCQVGPRDRLTKLTAQFGLEPDPLTWAITCLLIVPSRRREGLASWLLAELLGELKQQSVRRLEAFPKRGADLDAGDLWNGAEAMYREAGFRVVLDDPTRPVLALEL